MSPAFSPRPASRLTAFSSPPASMSDLSAPGFSHPRPCATNWLMSGSLAAPLGAPRATVPQRAGTERGESP